MIVILALGLGCTFQLAVLVKLSACQNPTDDCDQSVKSLLSPLLRNLLYVAYLIAGLEISVFLVTVRFQGFAGGNQVTVSAELHRVTVTLRVVFVNDSRNQGMQVSSLCRLLDPILVCPTFDDSSFGVILILMRFGSVRLQRFLDCSRA